MMVIFGWNVHDLNIARQFSCFFLHRDLNQALLARARLLQIFYPGDWSSQPLRHLFLYNRLAILDNLLLAFALFYTHTFPSTSVGALTADNRLGDHHVFLTLLWCSAYRSFTLLFRVLLSAWRSRWVRVNRYKSISWEGPYSHFLLFSHRRDLADDIVISIWEGAADFSDLLISNLELFSFLNDSLIIR